MNYIIYKITNKLNNKIYVGYHKTTDINDNYFGSGVAINRAIKKYGIENFEKEVLFIFNNEIEALNKEHEIVNEDFVSSKSTYNMTIGGNKPPSPKEWWNDSYSNALSERMKGNQYRKNKKDSKETIAKKKKSFADSDTHALHLKQVSDELRLKRSKIALSRRKAGWDPMGNPENRKKVSDSKIGLKKLTKGSVSKMAKPGSEKWNNLILEGYTNAS